MVVSLHNTILEIKNRAVQHQFDVLLVFMFDRIGRRDDETPFVVQWFVQQGIGEQMRWTSYEQWLPQKGHYNLQNLNTFLIEK